MFDIFKSRLEITGKLSTVTALRISSGRSTEPIGADLPVIKDALDRPLIPGASFKGALRSRLESFLRGIDINLAEDPANFTSQARNQAIIKLRKDYQDDAVLTDKLLEQTDSISRLFGSPWFASKFQVRDLTVVADTWFGQYQERDGVAIDRDTDTAADGKLYDFQVVPSGSIFDVKVVVENAEKWELGLLAIGLHQFESEQIPLGGGRSRGLGVVRLEIDQMQWFDAEGDSGKLLTYMQNQVAGNMDEYQYQGEEIDYFKSEWTEALLSYLRCLIPEKSIANTTNGEN